MSTDIKLSKAQISKIIQSVPVAKKVLAPLGLTAAMSAIDAGIQKKIHGSGTTTLIISNEEMNDMMKIVQALEDSNYLLKGVTKTIKYETKEQEGGFLSMLLGTLGASLLGNLLSGKGAVRTGKGIVRAGYDSSIKKRSSNFTTSFNKFEIKVHYENEHRLNDVYFKDNLPKTIKNGSYEINLDEYADVGTHCIALYVKNNELIYFDSFDVERVPKEIKRFIGYKNIKTNIFRIQPDNSIICGYFCMGFINFMFAGKSLIDYTSLFSPYNFKKNDKINLAYFK